MSIQFLDLRLSMNRNQAGGVQTLGATPVLLGDIGLQTAAADGTANEGDVRVALMGTIGFGAAGNNAILLPLNGIPRIHPERERLFTAEPIQLQLEQRRRLSPSTPQIFLLQPQWIGKSGIRCLSPLPLPARAPSLQ